MYYYIMGNISLFLFTIGLLFMIIGYVEKKNPKCNDEIDIQVVPRNVYDDIVNKSTI